MHTLDENYEHFLSTSFEANASFTGLVPSSSQAGSAINFGSYAFDENLFGGGDQLDLGLDMIAEIGDDLARELGDGWGVDIQNLPAECVPLSTEFINIYCPP